MVKEAYGVFIHADLYTQNNCHETGDASPLLVIEVVDLSMIVLIFNFRHFVQYGLQI